VDEFAWRRKARGHLAAAGFEVHFLDRRGSGLNADDPGDVDDWRTWIDDVAIYIRGFKTATPDAHSHGLPTVLAGISWGGKLAPAVARCHGALAHCGAASDGWPAKSIPQLHPQTIHPTSRSLSGRTAPKTLMKSRAAPGTGSAHHCAIRVVPRSWRPSSCSSLVQRV